MGQKIFNLDKWVHVEEGSTLHFLRDKPRHVAIDVNCPGDACFYVLYDAPPPKEGEEQPEGTAEQWFLGLARGRDRFEFAVKGDFKLYVEEGDAWIASSDGEYVHGIVDDPVIFTKIANRRARNPHLEMMQFMMQQNQNRFMEQMNAEMDRREQALEERYAEPKTARAPAAKFVQARAAQGGGTRTDGPDEDVRDDEEEVREGVTSGEGPKKRKPSPDTEQSGPASSKVKGP